MQSSARPPPTLGLGRREPPPTIITVGCCNKGDGTVVSYSYHTLGYHNPFFATGIEATRTSDSALHGPNYFRRFFSAQSVAYHSIADLHRAQLKQHGAKEQGGHPRE